MLKSGPRRLAFFAALFFSFSSLAAHAEFKVPSLTGPVVDLVGIFDNSSKQVIEQTIQTVYSHGRGQIQVLVVPSLNGDTIEAASIRVTDRWKLGTAKDDNGVLFMISTGDRIMRIEVGQGLEGDLPDARARRIIADIVTPSFRDGDYSGGVMAGVQAIAAQIDPQFKATDSALRPRRERGTSRQNDLSRAIHLFIFLIILLISFIGPRRRFGRRGLGGLAAGAGWSIGSGGGGGLGGGGWGGGGGGFSGGGSSGRW